MKRSKIAFFLILVAELIFMTGWWMRAKKDIQVMDSQVKKVMDEIKDLEMKNSQLKETLEKKVNNPFYMEKLAREKLGLAKKGELIYRIFPQGKRPED